MAGNYGDFIAKTVNQAKLTLNVTDWIPLQVGSAPQESRRHLKIQPKSPPGGAVAIAFVPKNADGSYTTPTVAVKGNLIYPGNSIFVEPVGDVVTVYGRLVQKKGFTDNSITVVVVEYS